MQKVLNVLVLVLVLGCDKAPVVPSNGGGAPLDIEGGAVIVTPEPLDAARPPEKLPPTGYYTLVMDENDGCTSKKAALSSSFEQPMLIPVKHDRGRTILNVPVVVTAGGGGAQARQDIGLEGKNNHTTKAPNCPSFETAIESEVTKATHDTIRIVRVETFGDGSNCPSPPPRTKCTRETVLTFTLKKALCEAPCNPMNIKILGDGGTDLECKCP